MKTISDGSSLRIADLENIGATSAPLLRELVRATLLPEHKNIDVDLSRTTFVDSEGLGALISAHKAVAPRGGSVRLHGASRNVRELFRLTRLDEIFEFVPAP